MRQAAGPLTENLPNVCLVNELPVLTDSFHRVAVKASRKESLHQGTMSRLSSHVVCLARLQRGRELSKAPWRTILSTQGMRELKGKTC